MLFCSMILEVLGVFMIMKIQSLLYLSPSDLKYYEFKQIIITHLIPVNFSIHCLSYLAIKLIVMVESDEKPEEEATVSSGIVQQ